LEEIEGSTNPEKFTALYKLQHGGIWCVLLGLVSLAGGTLQITFFVSIRKASALVMDLQADSPLLLFEPPLPSTTASLSPTPEN